MPTDVLNLVIMNGMPALLSDFLVRAEVQLQIDKQAQLPEQALSSLSAGRVVSNEMVDVWIDSLDTKHKRPPPRFDR